MKTRTSEEVLTEQIEDSVRVEESHDEWVVLREFLGGNEIELRATQTDEIGEWEDEDGKDAAVPPVPAVEFRMRTILGNGWGRPSTPLTLSATVSVTALQNALAEVEKWQAS